MEIEKFESFLKKHYVPPEYVYIAKKAPHSKMHVMIAEDFHEIPINLLHIIKMYYRRNGRLPNVEFTADKTVQFIEITIQTKVLKMPYKDIINTKKFMKELNLFYDMTEELVTIMKEFSILENLSYILTYALKSEGIDELVTLFMTGLTAGYGFGFNRVFLFVKRGKTYLGERAMGPFNGEEAHHLWEDLEYQNYDLNEFAKNVSNLKTSPSSLQKYVSHLKFSVTEENSVFFKNEEICKFSLDEIPADVKESLMITSPTVIMPITSELGDPGIFIMDNKFTNEYISKECVDLLKLFGKQINLIFQNFEMKEHLKDISRYDELTGVMNRRTLNFLPSRNGVLAMLDIDNFKEINDSLGHLEGDHVLRKFTNLLRMCIRTNDLIIRYGGDEFLIFFNETSIEKAKKIMERLLKLTEKNGIRFSAGIVKVSGKRSIEDSIKIADELLYKVKRERKGTFISEEEEAS